MTEDTLEQDSIPKENGKEILRLSEIYLDGTLKLGIAADSRAVTLSTMMATLMTATAAVGGAIISTSSNSPNLNILATASGVASVCYTIALYFASRAAEPVKFEVPGNMIDSFLYKETHGDVAQLYRGQIEVYQRQIKRNIEQLARAGSLMHRSLFWFRFAPAAAIATAIIIAVANANRVFAGCFGPILALASEAVVRAA